MRKLIKPIIGLLTMLFLSSCFGGTTSVVEEDEHDDLYYYYGDSISVYDKDALSGDVTFPTEYKGTKITKINPLGFEDCKNVTSFTIPSQFVSIGEGAFSGCSALTKIELPFIGGNKEAENTKETLFGYIFGNKSKEGCTSTRTYYYPFGGSVSSGYTSYIPSNLESIVITEAEKVHLGAFRNLTMLKSVVLNPEISEIGNNAFDGCTSLESLTFKEGTIKLSAIKEEAFKECKSLSIFNSTITGEFVLPVSLESVGEYAFEGCVKMEKFTAPFIGENRTAIDKHGFFGYIFGLRSHDDTILVSFDYWDSVLEMNHPVKLYIPKDLTHITITDAHRVPNYAFTNMSMLTSLRITHLAQDDIGRDAFNGCSAEPEWF